MDGNKAYANVNGAPVRQGEKSVVAGMMRREQNSTDSGSDSSEDSDKNKQEEAPDQEEFKDMEHINGMMINATIQQAPWGLTANMCIRREKYHTFNPSKFYKVQGTIGGEDIDFSLQTKKRPFKSVASAIVYYNPVPQISSGSSYERDSFLPMQYFQWGMQSNALLYNYPQYQFFTWPGNVELSAMLIAITILTTLFNNVSSLFTLSYHFSHSLERQSASVVNSTSPNPYLFLSRLLMGSSPFCYANALRAIVYMGLLRLCFDSLELGEPEWQTLSNRFGNQLSAKLQAIVAKCFLMICHDLGRALSTFTTSNGDLHIGLCHHFDYFCGLNSYYIQLVKYRSRFRFIGYMTVIGLVYFSYRYS
jgi:hypothetical protein